MKKKKNVLFVEFESLPNKPSQKCAKGVGFMSEAIRVALLAMKKSMFAELSSFFLDSSCGENVHQPEYKQKQKNQTTQITSR